MTVQRTIQTETEHFEIGDIIGVTLTDGEPIEAMAVKQTGENMIFCFVDCLQKEYRMNSHNTNKGGYEASELREKLGTEILLRLPEELRMKMLPFENGDLLRLPTEKEIFGENRFGLDEPETVAQWEPMKLRRNRIAFQGSNGPWEWYWLANPALRDPASAAYFAFVSHDGSCTYSSASNATIGVRPAFQIKNL